MEKEIEKKESEKPKEDIEKDSKSSCVSDCIKNLGKRAQKRPFETIVVIINIIIVIFIYLTYLRDGKLFVGQNKPLVDVTPIGIIPGIAEDGNKMCKIKFSLVNYSGFPAKDISLDVKYGDKEWISEWLKANKDSERKEKQDKLRGVELNHEYISSPDIVMKYLEPGKTGEKKLVWPEIHRRGQLDLEKDVVGNKEGYPILVRVTWQNKGKHVFEKIQKYKLLCTTTGIGHAFTFISEGIISQTTNE